MNSNKVGSYINGVTEMTPEEAQASLLEIQAAGRRVRRTIEYGGAPELLWTWGGVWLVGYLATYCLVLSQHYDWIGPIWWSLSALGGGLTAWICMRHPIRSLQDRNIGWMWLAIVVYGALWIALFKPSDMQYGINAFIATLIMFAWVMIGLISRIMLWAKLGVLGTALIAVGYWWLAPSPAFWLWMGLAAGGMMLFMGTYLAVQEKRSG